MRHVAYAHGHYNDTKRVRESGTQVPIVIDTLRHTIHALPPSSFVRLRRLLQASHGRTTVRARVACHNAAAANASYIADVRDDMRQALRYADAEAVMAFRPKPGDFQKATDGDLGSARRCNGQGSLQIME